MKNIRTINTRPRYLKLETGTKVQGVYMDTRNRTDGQAGYYHVFKLTDFSNPPLTDHTGERLGPGDTIRIDGKGGLAWLCDLPKNGAHEVSFIVGERVEITGGKTAWQFTDIQVGEPG